MRRVGEFATVTSRGNPIIRVVWERPCEVCGAPFRFSLPAGCPPEAANGYTTTCFAHSADKRARKAKRTARARHRSPSRKRHRRAPP